MVLDVPPNQEEILQAIFKSEKLERRVSQQFGAGNSALKFKAILDDIGFWPVSTDKIFIDNFS
jgi:hypothetical protein